MSTGRETKIQLLTRLEDSTTPIADVELYRGEPLYDKSTGILYIGRGDAAGTGLSKDKSTIGDWDYLTNKPNINVINREEYSINGPTSDELTSIYDTETPHHYDIIIIKNTISTGKHSFTAYVYNAEKSLPGWEAMDGNYSADNVYFSDDLISAFTIGNFNSLTNGSVTITAAGESIRSLWDKIYLKEIKTNLTNSSPSCTIDAPSLTYLQVGQTYDPSNNTVTLSLNEGSYDYGYGYVNNKVETVADGTKAVSLVRSGTGATVDNNYKPTTSSDARGYELSSSNIYIGDNNKTSDNNQTGSFSLYSIKHDSQKQASITGKIYYKDCGNPVSNLDNIYPKQNYSYSTTNNNFITKSTNNSTFTLARWYYPIYYGFTSEDINQTTIKKGWQCSAEDCYDMSKLYTATAASAWRKFFYAFPSSFGWTMSNAKDNNNLTLTVKSMRNQSFTINGVSVNYDIFYIENIIDYEALSITWEI